MVLLSTSAHRDEHKMVFLERADQILLSLSQEYQVDYVDVKTPMLAVMEYNRNSQHPIMLFTDGSHLSELGNMLIADTVYDYLVSHQ